MSCASLIIIFIFPFGFYCFFFFFFFFQAEDGIRDWSVTGVQTCALPISLILLFYFKSVRAVISIFIPVVLGLGITALATRVFIGHINVITGFLVGIKIGRASCRERV